MILSNLKIFLTIKTGMENLSNIDICNSILDYNREMIIKKINNKKFQNFKLKIDLNLISYSIENLINKIKINDVMLFLKVTQINFLVEFPDQVKIPLSLIHI